MAARMSLQRRRLVGLLIAVALMAGSAIFTTWRMKVIGGEGWAGLAYMPDIKTGKNQPPPPKSGLYRPGLVWMIYPGSPAERGGIERLTRLVSIDGIPISDLKK